MTLLCYTVPQSPTIDRYKQSGGLVGKINYLDAYYSLKDENTADIDIFVDSGLRDKWHDAASSLIMS